MRLPNKRVLTVATMSPMASLLVLAGTALGATAEQCAMLPDIQAGSAAVPDGITLAELEADCGSSEPSPTTETPPPTTETPPPTTEPPPPTTEPPPPTTQPPPPTTEPPPPTTQPPPPTTQPPPPPTTEPTPRDGGPVGEAPPATPPAETPLFVDPLAGQDPAAGGDPASTMIDELSGAYSNAGLVGAVVPAINDFGDLLLPDGTFAPEFGILGAGDSPSAGDTDLAAAGSATGFGSFNNEGGVPVPVVVAILGVSVLGTSFFRGRFTPRPPAAAPAVESPPEGGDTP